MLFTSNIKRNINYLIRKCIMRCFYELYSLFNHLEKEKYIYISYKTHHFLNIIRLHKNFVQVFVQVVYYLFQTLFTM